MYTPSQNLPFELVGLPLNAFVKQSKTYFQLAVPEKFENFINESIKDNNGSINKPGIPDTSSYSDNFTKRHQQALMSVNVQQVS